MATLFDAEPLQAAFEELLNATVIELNKRALAAPDAIEKLKGNKLEPYTQAVMEELAIGTPFENTIELIGGQKFPDIVVHKTFGIEVKTTTQNPKISMAKEVFSYKVVVLSF